MVPKLGRNSQKSTILHKKSTLFYFFRKLSLLSPFLSQVICEVAIHLDILGGTRRTKTFFFPNFKNNSKDRNSEVF
jgi:hypothetical protein